MAFVSIFYHRKSNVIFWSQENGEEKLRFLVIKKKKMLKFPISIFPNLRGQHMLLSGLLSLATFTGFISEMLWNYFHRTVLSPNSFQS